VWGSEKTGSRGVRARGRRHSCCDDQGEETDWDTLKRGAGKSNDSVFVQVPSRGGRERERKRERRRLLTNPWGIKIQPSCSEGE